DVPYAPRERREHQREALRDAAGVDAGAVQGDAALAAGALDLRRARARAGEEPAEWRHHVLAGLEDADQLRPIRQERCVEHAVRLEREQRVRVAAGMDAERAEPAELAGIAAHLRRIAYVHDRELELRV